MKFSESKIKGVYLIECFNSIDNRGSFKKVFNYEEFKNHGLDFQIEEVFITSSKKNTIRGMHFSLPPKEQIKLVICYCGHIKDVVLDLRKSSPTYLQYVEFDLNANETKAVLVPIGCAHGFKAIEDNSVVAYCTSCGFSKEHDSGIRFDSFNYDWKLENPIMSNRDKSLVSLNNFKNPF